MTLRSLHRWYWGVLGVCAVFALTPPVNAQIGLGRGSQGTGPRPIGPIGGDPLDGEKEKNAARKKADELLQAGNKLLEKGRIVEAKGKFRQVIALVGAEGSGQAALGRLLDMHKDGMANLEQAADLFEKKQFLEALDLAKKTKILYANLLSGLPIASSYPVVSQEAALLIKQMESDPLAKEAIQEAQAAAKFKKVERLEKKAEKDPAAYYDLYKALKNIVKRHPDCPTGKECASRLNAIKEDSKLMKRIKREEERRVIVTALRRIDDAEAEGKDDQAKAERDKLAKRFPGKTIEELRRVVRG